MRQVLRKHGVMALVLFGFVAIFASGTVEAATVPRANGSVVDSDYWDDDDFVPFQGERFDSFDWSLFKQVSEKYPGNTLLSPVSLKIALVLLYEGAQGQTANELAAALRLPGGRAATRDRFTTILRSLQAVSSDYVLDIGTRLILDDSIVPRQRYASIIKAFYSTDLVRAHFSDSAKVAEDINAWKNNITHGHIKQRISDDEGLKDSLFMVLNALYFKGTWRQQFPKNATRSLSFFTGVENSIQVDFMHTLGRFYYSESSELNAQILRLPYLGHKYAMFIVLPRQRTGLQQLIRDINPFILRRHVWLMEDVPVDVTIPKFKFEFASHLESVLRELGIRDIFDNTASLPGIARGKETSPRLTVSDVVQQAGLEVNEEGTTAQVVTEVQVGNKISERTFHATHPFIFYIEDESTGTIVFIGKVTDPSASGSIATAAIPELPSRFGDSDTSDFDLQILAQKSDRFNFFDIELLQSVTEATAGNVILSPASVKVALTTMVEGTGGRTRTEILSALRLPADVQVLRTTANQAIAPFKISRTGVELDLATRLWTGSNVVVNPHYVDVLRQYYGGESQSVNFGDAAKSSKTINDWVRQKTRGHIQSLVDPGSLEPGTKLLLTNALYLKGNWMHAFDRSLTKVQCFHTTNNDCQYSYLMENVGYYGYGYVPSLDADVVDIPYADGKLSMIILLPDRVEGGIMGLSRDFAHTPLSTIIASLRKTEVLVTLPRFTIESKLDLKHSLEKLGIRDLFDINANVSGIVSGPFQVGSVLHNAKIEVNEEGTIASAVTGIAVVPLMGSTVQRFRADHPFIFILRDSQTGSVLFAGRVTKPDVAPHPQPNYTEVFGKPPSDTNTRLRFAK